jgi:hypothetical protein
MNVQPHVIHAYIQHDRMQRLASPDDWQAKMEDLALRRQAEVVNALAKEDGPATKFRVSACACGGEHS